LGCLSRIAAFGVAMDMIGALLLVHSHYGLFMNWQGAKKGEGFEFHILLIAMSLAVMIAGGGAFSVDRALSKNKDV
jgi:putative oxidoreductase